jgi:Transposase DDE domain group 1
MAGLEPQPGIAAGRPGSPLRSCRFVSQLGLDANTRSLTTLREKLVKIGARIVRHGRYIVFQLAEVAVPRALFADILRRIDGLRPQPPPLPA